MHLNFKGVNNGGQDCMVNRHRRNLKISSVWKGDWCAFIPSSKTQQRPMPYLHMHRFIAVAKPSITVTISKMWTTYGVLSLSSHTKRQEEPWCRTTSAVLPKWPEWTDSAHSTVLMQGLTGSLTPHGSFVSSVKSTAATDWINREPAK